MALMTPPLTLTATPQSILAGAATASQLKITLCGFQADAPRVQGSAIFAPIAEVLKPNVAANPAITTPIWGNDLITPKGTFYCVQLMDANGNTIWAENYQLIGTGTVDLSTVPPYNPLTVPLEDLLIELTYAPNPVIDLSLGNTFLTVLTGNTAPTFVNAMPGDIYVFIWNQGNLPTGYTVTWPANIINATAINPIGLTVQKFICGSDGKLRPTSQPMYF